LNPCYRNLAIFLQLWWNYGYLKSSQTALVNFVCDVGTKVGNDPPQEDLAKFD
jgi:hypothetical protein